MKTILIPTDFSIAALDCVPELCYKYQDEKVSLVFVHLFKLSDSIGELLMLSRRSKEYQHISNDFYNKCNELKKQCPNLSTMRMEFFYGSTLNMFKNFLEANEVDCILDATHCSCNKINKTSIDPIHLVTKSGVPTVTITKRVEKPVQKVVLEQEENLLAESLV